MKIERFDLIAFGPFTDQHLDLTAGNFGLHMIYGPNEAGKSTALRGLGYLLFGFPSRVSDNFLHPYPRLRVGGSFKNSDLSVLDVVRRKTNANSLLTPDEKEVIDESVFRQFFTGMDKEIFFSMFGIDHESLVEGGREIITGDGEIGKILFSAGAGIKGLHKLQKELSAECETLFKPSGKIPRINKSISSLRSIRKTIEEVRLPEQQWMEHDRVLKDVKLQKESVDSRIKTLSASHHRLSRIVRALPAIARRSQIQNEVKDLGKTVILPEDFRKIRIKAQTDLKIAGSHETEAASNIEEIKARLEKLDIPDRLIEKAEDIKELYQEMGSVKKAEKDRIMISGLKSSLMADAREILSELRPELQIENAKQIRLEKAHAVQIRELAAKYERLATRRQNIREKIDDITFKKNDIHRQFDSLPAPRPTGDLGRILENVRQYGDIESHFMAEQKEFQRQEQNILIALDNMPFWTGNLSELEKLPVIPDETIDYFEDHINRAEDTTRNLIREKTATDSKILQIDSQISKLSLEQEVPTEQDLQKSRDDRNSFWSDILQSLKNQMSVSDESLQIFAKSLRHADMIADRLRREADRVARKAALISEKEKFLAQAGQLEISSQSAVEEVEKLKNEWISLWKNLGKNLGKNPSTCITPRSPREMRSWTKRQIVLIKDGAELRAQKEKIDSIKAMIDQLKHQVKECLFLFDNELGDKMNKQELSLADLLETGTSIVERSSHILAERNRLLKEIMEKEKELEQGKNQEKRIENSHKKWRTQWAQAVISIGLGPEASPGQASAVMDEIKTLFDKLKEAEILTKRIEGIDRDAANFEQKIREFVATYTPDMSESSHNPQKLAEALNNRLSDAVAAAGEKNALLKRLNQETIRFEKAKNQITEKNAMLSAMCETAGCSRYNELPGAEDRSDQHIRLNVQLDQVQKELLELSGGRDIKSFIMEAEQENPDVIETEIKRLEEQIEEAGREKSDVDQTIGKESEILKQMNGNARAADLAEEVQQQMAILQKDSEQYARLRLASTVLLRGIELYREKNQGPVLRRTNELFKELTLGSFDGIRLEPGDKGNTVLVGIRSDTKEAVPVGGMSEGSADQLYLAVRLASLESWLDRNEAIPLIVDDILIQFDDERALAALQILARLSAKTQVIFFTHHMHLVKLAEEHIPANVLCSHNLFSRHRKKA